MKANIELFGDLGTSAVPAVFTAISMCVWIVPAKIEETVQCSQGGRGGRGYYVHAGTWGMRVSVSGSFEFDPLVEYRR